MRTGDEYMAALRDGRRVMIDGQQVDDVTTHPAFAAAVRTVARMYDMSAAAENAELMTVADPDGRPIHRCWSIPRNAGDLRVRHAAIEAWSRLNLGLMGRTPDLGASFLAGFAGAAELIGERADNVTAFVRRAAAEDLYVSYAIVPPQIDRSRPAHAQDDPHAYAGVFSESAEGIVIRGAQMLGTGTAISDMVLLSSIVPLQAGDEAQAISVVIPVSAPGVKVYSRRSYASAAQGREREYPLSANFDETDSLLVFDDVLVPWEHVFIYKDIQLTRDQWYATSSHALGNNQSQVRFAVKLRAMVGALLEVVDAGATDPSDRLPELQALATMVDATVRAGEDACEIDAWGVAAPGRPELYANMVLQSRITPHVLAAAREILGERSLLAGLQPHRLDGEGTGCARAEAAWRLAWDLLGSEFAGRQHQYELFYAGAPFVVRRHMARHYDSAGARELVAPMFADDFGLAR